MSKLKVKNNVPVAKEEKERQQWPFKDMLVGSVVDVPVEAEWRSAQRYAHQFAAKNGWKMQTNWMGKFGRIRRVS